jgi:hypothetical protein
LEPDRNKGITTEIETNMRKLMDIEKLEKAAQLEKLGSYITGLCQLHDHDDGHGGDGSIETLREDDYKGHDIMIRTTYKIEVTRGLCRFLSDWIMMETCTATLCPITNSPRHQTWWSVWLITFPKTLSGKELRKGPPTEVRARRHANKQREEGSEMAVIRKNILTDDVIRDEFTRGVQLLTGKQWQDYSRPRYHRPYSVGQYLWPLHRLAPHHHDENDPAG